jgi:shikimate kinase
MNLVLMGLRGSGKTTIGRLAAVRLGWLFVDLDEAVAASMGEPTVAAAWKSKGEPAFRRAEAQALKDILKNDRQVIALGGGTPTAPGAADLLRTHRQAARLQVVYLAAGADALRSRLAGTDLSARPSLTGADPLVEISAVLQLRDPVYRELAGTVVWTEGRTVQDVVELVVSIAGMGA